VKRRDFITLLAGAGALALPVTTHAQERMRRIGVLMALPENDPAAPAEVDALQQALAQLGWATGRNIQIDYRWPGSDVERARVLAAQLVARKPDVLLARSTPATAALLRETKTIPIVFLQVAEPISSGFVQSLARPGGSVTGFTNFETSIGGKWMELLKEVSPKLKRAAILFNPRTAPYSALFVTSIERAEPAIGIETMIMPFQGPADIERALADFAKTPNGGLICIPDTSNTSNRELIVELAARHRLPAVYAFTDFARAGGLLVFAVDTLDLLRRAAGYADRILKGENPAELPVQGPAKFVLSVNLKVAKALGIEVPPSVLVRADEVIE
jgi:putative ABC transport system substrate-binding protein